jgi:FtsP/CotA-like multicopper oxidase with cupredoxin domain
MALDRRQFLQTVTMGGFGLLAPGFHQLVSAAETDSWFQNPLALPPLEEGRLIDGARRFDLTLQYGVSNFLGDRPTPTVGINANYLGPVLRVLQGDDVMFRVTNRLAEPSTLHWHGLNLPAVMDGGPHQVIASGKTWSSEFKIRQGACTQWYHSHMYHRTGIQVYFGLAGLLYIDDKESKSLNLPSQYGVDDIPLVLQDRSFNQDGSLRYASSMHDRMMGVMGQTMLVNGTTFARFEAQKPLTRFRILNGSNARIYNLEFEDQREFLQIASDGGLLAQPVAMRSSILAPGERIEILVEFAPGESVMLRHKSLPRRPGGGSGMMGMMSGMMAASDSPFPIMRCDASRVVSAAQQVPTKLIKPRNWAYDEAVRTRRFNLDMGMGMGRGGFSINGKSMDINRIDARVPLGDIEVWEISNTSPMAHPFHIHDVQFRIIERDGRPPGANEEGLKDTVLVNSGERVRLVMQFENYADAKAPYMFHCHILEHEDAGMMGQFVVVS